MRALAISFLISTLILSCKTNSASPPSGLESTASLNRLACGSVTGAGNGEFDFRAICVNDTTATAKTGTLTREDYFYSVTRDPSIPKIYYLEPTSGGNGLTLILKVKPGYTVTSLVDALIEKNITLDGAGGRLWITGHPVPGIGGEGSYIADDFKLSETN